MVKLYGEWVKKYPIVSLEDGMGEEDRDGWLAITKALGKKLQLVGDDNFVTNPKIFAAGIRDGIANAILIKLNQIGTGSSLFSVEWWHLMKGCENVHPHPVPLPRERENRAPSRSKPVTGWAGRAWEQRGKSAGCSLSPGERARVRAGVKPFFPSPHTPPHPLKTAKNQYLRRLRMDKAADLLRNGEHNVTEAALEVGYNSLSHFSAAFHETLGCCPGLYPLKSTTQRARS